jgi:hypothetical protein
MAPDSDIGAAYDPPNGELAVEVKQALLQILAMGVVSLSVIPNVCAPCFLARCAASTVSRGNFAEKEGELAESVSGRGAEI